MSADDVAAVVLAGTHHWSGSSFERLAPRPLVPVALSPLIAYSLRWLRRGGVGRAVICGNGTTRVIEAALGSGAPLAMELSYHQDETPRGAAGCVRDAGWPTGSQALVVTSGTAIPTVDLPQLLACHDASGAALTVVVHRERSHSAPPAAGAVYVFARRVLDYVAESGFQDIKESLIPRLHRAGERVVAHHSEGFCPNVLDARTYLAVNEWMVQSLALQKQDGLIHPTARVERGARLVGPVQLGAGALVEAGATVVGPATIGAESTVGRNALVARSVVWDRALMGEGSVVHGCVVGHDVVVPPAARLFHVVCPQAPLPLGPRPGKTVAPSGPAFAGRLPGALPTSCPIG